MSGIYIHIPFCKQACSYCDFYFVTRHQLKPAFVDALLAEIDSAQHTQLASQPIETIYFGGGTPSLLAAGEIEQIMAGLDKVFDLNLKEVTLEINPDDAESVYLEELKSIGVNRLSMGIQSFNHELLRFMNRAHTPGEAVRALEAVKKTGFISYTADLIYGNPAQSMKTLETDIRKLLEFDPPHISAYSLTIESGTRLGKMMELGRLQPPDDELVLAHFEMVQELFAAHDINQYEVSNYAKEGAEALHNSNYWNHHNYAGFGPSAHSFWWQSETEAKRWKNRPDIKSYLNPKFEETVDEIEYLDLQQLAEERIMLGLRTVNGIQFSELERKYHYSFSDRQIEWLAQQNQKKVLQFQDDSVVFTGTGLRIADYLVVELLSRH